MLKNGSSRLSAPYPLQHANQGKSLLLAEGTHPLMREKTVLPADKAYAGARQIWNGAVNRFPAVFALCETADDVRAAIWAARTMDFLYRSAAADMIGRDDPCVRMGW